MARGKWSRGDLPALPSADLLIGEPRVRSQVRSEKRGIGSLPAAPAECWAWLACRQEEIEGGVG